MRCGKVSLGLLVVLLGACRKPVGEQSGLALGFHHDWRFENVFLVDWRDGDFSVLYGGDGKKLAVPAAGLARVRAKCPR
jgi:hypothetical protein